MVSSAYRPWLRHLKGCLGTFFAGCVLCMLAILRSVEYVEQRAVPQPGDTQFSSGNSVIKFQVFPRGGDEVPTMPNWTIPELPVEEDHEKFTRHPDAKYVATNFSFSPGLGNNMFQYASLLGIAEALNATLLLPSTGLIRRSFLPTAATLVTSAVLGNLTQAWGSVSKVILADCCRYYPSALEPNTTNVFVMGYLQSWRYFHPHAQDLIRQQFAFLPQVRSRAEAAVSKALAEGGRPSLGTSDSTLVAVHVRAGMDVSYNVRNRAHGHAVAPLTYFHNAMDHFRRRFANATFVVSSDNIYWCKKHLAAKDVVFVRGGSREVDLAALSLCSHAVVSTGTFGWWAAYLAGGEAVYYASWPRSGSQMDRMTAKEDYFLPHWIPIGSAPPRLTPRPHKSAV